MTFNKELCEERHENIDREFKRMRTRMNGIDAKLWALIILLVANLAFVIRALLQ